MLITGETKLAKITIEAESNNSGAICTWGGLHTLGGPWENRGPIIFNRTNNDYNVELPITS